MGNLDVRKVYSVWRSNGPVEVGKDFLTLMTSHSDRRIRLLRVELYGMGTVSSPVEILVARSDDDMTGGTGGDSARAFEPESDTLSVAGSGWGWTTQPTLRRNLFTMTVNADGGVSVWEANRDDDGPTENDDYDPEQIKNISFRAVQGVGPISLVVVYDEWGN